MVFVKLGEAGAEVEEGTGPAEDAAGEFGGVVGGGGWLSYGSGGGGEGGCERRGICEDGAEG